MKRQGALAMDRVLHMIVRMVMRRLMRQGVNKASPWVPHRHEVRIQCDRHLHLQLPCQSRLQDKSNNKQENGREYLGARCQKYVPAHILKIILCFCVLFAAGKYIIEFII